MRVSVLLLLPCLFAFAAGRKFPWGIVCIFKPFIDGSDYVALKIVNNIMTAKDPANVSLKWANGLVSKYSEKMDNFASAGGDMVAHDFITLFKSTVGTTGQLIIRNRDKLQADINNIHKGGKKTLHDVIALYNKLKASAGYKKLDGGTKKVLAQMMFAGAGIQLLKAMTTPQTLSLKTGQGDAEERAIKMLSAILLTGGVNQYLQQLRKPFHDPLSGCGNNILINCNGR